jgi:hypothetical protein
MTLTPEERSLLISALRNDKVGNWGDGRQERINALLKKVEAGK